jgi:hypothetical protein
VSAPDSALAQRLLTGVGLDVAPPVRRVLQFVRDLEEVSPDEITPELIEAPEGLAEEECKAATEYLLRMGLLVSHGDKLRPEPVLSGLLAQS